MVGKIQLPPRDELVRWDPTRLAEELSIQTNPASITAWELKLRRICDEELPRLNGYGRPREPELQAHWKKEPEERKLVTQTEMNNLLGRYIRADALGKWLATLGYEVAYEVPAAAPPGQQRSLSRLAAAEGYKIPAEWAAAYAETETLRKGKKVDRYIELLLSEIDKRGYDRSCLPDDCFREVQTALQKSFGVTPSATKRAWTAASKDGRITHNRKLGGGKRAGRE
ncbi:MAG: hypothetical protein HY749_15835 [Gammaproteobacteria bacterium]|nr:hypothetical protein [Gammaproteobacteria bacterium]